MTLKFFLEYKVLRYLIQFLFTQCFLSGALSFLQTSKFEVVWVAAAAFTDCTLFHSRLFLLSQWLNGRSKFSQNDRFLTQTSWTYYFECDQDLIFKGFTRSIGSSFSIH